jgi:FtsH-binding integral membrane protein
VLKIPHNAKPQNVMLFAPTTDAIPFLIYYILAIFNKRDTPKHMRYMIATGIVIGGPGLGRIFMTWMGMDIFAAIGLITLITLLVFVGLIIYDRIKKKQFRINPYTIAFIIWLIPNILIIFFPNTTLWQNFAKWLVTTI